MVGVRSALGLERACEFIKAFGERGGDLHVTERQHRQVHLVPLDQPEGTKTINIYSQRQLAPALCFN